MSSDFGKDEWYVDSGCSFHLTANENWIKNMSSELTTTEIVVANKEKLPVKCCGNVMITTFTKKCEYDVEVENVLCVPSLTTNLLSVSELIKNGNTVKFTKVGCNIYNKIGELVATACLINGVYKLNVTEVFGAAAMVSGETWHRRLGHCNSNYLNKMQDAVEGLTLDK
ncbi:uncharacterized protein LOC125229209 [Leguminivora glycinivorella]|uniref:uncharacterized protein LOC125229209 n=1 Tax=Leguminivora glycinivorella TaxID=1035111 RepID=UPI00200C9808|nr:uncharacterized protein LOC125229209 [Leguminivora glycinivorella]